MPFDPNKSAMQRHQLATAIQALMREEAVVNYYAARGKKVISTDDNQTRTLLKISAAEKAADVLIEMAPGQLVITEVKGSNLDSAIEQLKNTARRATHLYKHIACKIFVKNTAPAPPENNVELRGGRYGFRAVRVFRSDFPGEWILYEYDAMGATHPVKIGSDQVCIVFGPLL